jgi:hypothetical protein
MATRIKPGLLLYPKFPSIPITLLPLLLQPHSNAEEDKIFNLSSDIVHQQARSRHVTGA